MHYYETIHTSTFDEFLQTVQEFKNEGYRLTDTKTDKCIMFDGKNTVVPYANVYAILDKGSATYTIIYTI